MRLLYRLFVLSVAALIVLAIAITRHIRRQTGQSSGMTKKPPKSLSRLDSDSKARYEGKLRSGSLVSGERKRS